MARPPYHLPLRDSIPHVPLTHGGCLPASSWMVVARRARCRPGTLVEAPHFSSTSGARRTGHLRQR
ncbi:hypothetical protein E2562_031784 [Oryza meyeriana var. granulata]|uniref:Uncharacterized protein n=1 Tax=Oryza meyeriana var. granulata TaxID=110450 RepID=A0A6G1EC22_9ORYZ|nr:hypothetical protein E2562_031784 [Oryza meyeriana var. granulata]